jgi:hypothetical protein
MPQQSHFALRSPMKDDAGGIELKMFAAANARDSRFPRLLMAQRVGDTLRVTRTSPMATLCF